MKQYCFIIVAALFVGFSLNAQQFNGDRQSYVTELHSSSIIGLSAADALGDALRGQGGVALGGEFTEFDNDSDSDREYEGDRETYGGSLSYTHVFENFTLAAMLTFFETEADYDGTDANGGTFETDGDGIVFSIGAGAEFGDFFLSVTGGWGESSSDSERLGAFGLMQGDYDTSFYFLEFKAVYDWIVNEDYAVLPSFKLGYQVIEIDSFEEETLVLLSDRTAFEAIEDDVLYAEIGILAEYYGFDNVVPFVSVSVWQDLGDDEVELEGVGFGPLSSDVPDLFQTMFTIETGATMQLGNGWEVDAGVAYFAGDSMDGFNLSLSTTLAF